MAFHGTQRSTVTVREDREHGECHRDGACLVNTDDRASRPHRNAIFLVAITSKHDNKAVVPSTLFARLGIEPPSPCLPRSHLPPRTVTAVTARHAEKTGHTLPSLFIQFPSISPLHPFPIPQPTPLLITADTFRQGESFHNHSFTRSTKLRLPRRLHLNTNTRKCLLSPTARHHLYVMPHHLHSAAIYIMSNALHHHVHLHDTFESGTDASQHHSSPPHLVR